jgi:plastocyanin
MMLRVARSAFLVGLLCVVGGASAAIASTSGHRSRPRGSHAARSCHRARHRHCALTRGAKKSHRKHKRHTSSKPHGVSQGPSSTTPWGTVPSSVAPGASPTPGAPAPGTMNGGPPVGAPVAPAVPAHVLVTAEDTEAFHFILSRPTVPAGKVIIEFVNHGQDEHNLNAVEPTEGSVAGSLPDTASNAHLSLTLNLHPGSYTLFCSLPGHEAKGMRATLVVN